MDHFLFLMAPSVRIPWVSHGSHGLMYISHVLLKKIRFPYKSDVWPGLMLESLSFAWLHVRRGEKQKKGRRESEGG